MLMHYIVICDMYEYSFYRIFPHCHKRHDCRENVTVHKTCVLIPSTCLSETSLILRRIQWDTKINVHRASCKLPLLLSDFNGTWNFWTYFRKKFKYQISWKTFQWEPSCSIRADGRRDRTKLLVAFRNFGTDLGWKELNLLGLMQLMSLKGSAVIYITDRPLRIMDDWWNRRHYTRRGSVKTSDIHYPVMFIRQGHIVTTVLASSVTSCWFRKKLFLSYRNRRLPGARLSRVISIPNCNCALPSGKRNKVGMLIKWSLYKLLV